MRYWYDTEFLDNGTTIALISIGIVAEDGREYYAVNEDAPWPQVGQHQWLCEHVVPYLPLVDAPRHAPEGVHFLLDLTSDNVKPHQEIAQEVERFLLAGENEPELWAYYGGYDYVVLNQLWGPMVNHPQGLPMYLNDIMQTVRELGVDPAELPRQQGGQHHALADARHNRTMWRWLTHTAQQHPRTTV